MTDIDEVKPISQAERAFLEGFVKEHDVQVHVGMKFVIATEDGIQSYEPTDRSLEFIHHGSNYVLRQRS